MAGFTNKARALRRFVAIPKFVRAAVLAQNEANARDLVRAQKRAAPKDDLTLEASIEATDESKEHRVVQRIRAGGATTTKPVRKSEKGGAPNYDYALGQEFGTEDMPANPFFFPPYRARRKGYRASLRKAARDAVKKGASVP